MTRSQTFARQVGLLVLTMVVASSLACDAFFDLTVDNQSKLEVAVWIGSPHDTTLRAAPCRTTEYQSLVYNPGRPFKVIIKDPSGQVVLDKDLRPEGRPPKANIIVLPSPGKECSN